MKSRLLICALVAVLCLPLLALSPPPQARANVELSIDVGYNGYFRTGQWTPVRINASNTGDGVAGELRVRTGGLSGIAETTYRTPIDLPSGAHKQVFLYVSLEGLTQDLQVEFISDAGDALRRETARVRVADRSDILLAVVTSSALGAVDLTGRTPGPGVAHQTSWQIDELPPLAEALAGLDVLLFHDVDTGTLSEDQRTAIRRWILNGGHLLVTGGDGWQRTTAGFGGLLPATFEGTESVDSLAPLAEYLRVDPAPVDASITLTHAEPTVAARTLVAVGDLPLVVRGSLGEGVVDFLTFDPNAEPVRSWAEKAQLWYTLIASVGQKPSWADGFSSWSLAREATLTLSSNVLPTMVQLCGFLALYIVLVGPVNYLVLKRLNRREWAWFTIPVLIVVFSVLAYTVGFNLRGNVATVNRLTVARVWPDSDEAQLYSLIGVQSPRRSSYDVAVEHGITLRTLPGIGTGLGTDATIDEGTRYVAEDVPIDAGTIASFAASGHTAAPQIELAAVWELSANRAAHLRGTVTNTSGLTLQDAVVVIKGGSRSLGTLQPGDSRTFTLPIAPADPGPMSPGNPLSIYTPYVTPTWQYGYNSAGWCFTPEGLYLTLPDVMGHEIFSCSAGGVSPREQEVRRRYRLLGSLIVDRDLSGGRGAEAFLFAWTDEPLIEVELVDKMQKAEDTTLYIFDIPVTTSALSGEALVPTALTTWTTLDDSASGVPPSQFQLSGGDVAAFQFMPLPEVQLAEVTQIDLHFDAIGQLQVEIWDWQAQAWRRVALDPADPVTTIGSAARYTGPENAVNIRVTPLDATAFHQVDYVKVAYRGRFIAEPPSASVQAVSTTEEQVWKTN